MPGWEWAWRVAWLAATYLFLFWLIRQADRWARPENPSRPSDVAARPATVAAAVSAAAASEQATPAPAGPAPGVVGGLATFAVEEGQVLVHDSQADAGRKVGQGQPFTCDSAASHRWHWGRAQENDVVFLDPYVSAWHTALYVQAGQLWIEDRGSRNGTWVNGRAIKGAETLSPGDVIRLGNTQVRWVGWSAY